jgi:hypothetical protein
LFAAARDNRIKALIAYDGSMRYYPGLVEAGHVHPERMTLPLLFFTRGNLSLEDWDGYHGVGKDGSNVLNAWTHGDLWTIRMLGMSHPEFASDDATAMTFLKSTPAENGVPKHFMSLNFRPAQPLSRSHAGSRADP